MNKDFLNKVAIITGSSMGIGKQMAIELASRGAKVVLNGRNKERLEKTAQDLTQQGFEVFPISGDVSNIEDCENLAKQTVAKFGQIDILINNAGLSTEGTIEELDGNVIKKIMDVNYLGSVYPTQSALPFIKKSKGSIIFISSVAGLRGLPNYAVYSSSKMALTALAESLRIELSNDGVHIGIAYVGFTQNDAQKTIYAANGELIPQPKRDFIKPEPVEIVAKRVISMVKMRTFKKVFTSLGKLNAVMNKVAPSVVHHILKRNFNKQTN